MKPLPTERPRGLWLSSAAALSLGAVAFLFAFAGTGCLFEPDGSGGGGGGADGGCCCDPNTGICTELVSGDAEDWEAGCGSGSPGVFHSSCSSGAFACLDAASTNELTGAPVIVNIYFPSGFCNTHPNTNTAGSCANLGGCCTGSHCPDPNTGTVPSCPSC